MGFPFSTSLHESELRGEDRSDSVLSFILICAIWMADYSVQPLVPNVSIASHPRWDEVLCIALAIYISQSKAQRCTVRAKIAGHKWELHISLLRIALRIIIEARSCMIETIIASHVKTELNMRDSLSPWSWNLASLVHFWRYGCAMEFCRRGLHLVPWQCCSCGIISMWNWKWMS